MYVFGVYVRKCVGVGVSLCGCVCVGVDVDVVLCSHVFCASYSQRKVGSQPQLTVKTSMKVTNTKIQRESQVSLH